MGQRVQDREHDRTATRVGKKSRKLLTQAELSSEKARDTELQDIQSWTSAGMPVKKTMAALKKTPRSVLRPVADCAENLKQMWATSERGQYMESIRADIGKSLLNVDGLHAAVEALIMSSKSEPDDLEESAELLALSERLDKEFEAYNEIKD